MATVPAASAASATREPDTLADAEVARMMELTSRSVFALPSTNITKPWL